MVGPLVGRRVVVAGAGLAGLVAARDLERAGATVAMIEARDRVGGRLQTLREGFAGDQHAEAGADLIEGEQEHVLALARELGLEPVRILRRGWGYYGADARGHRRVRRGTTVFSEAARRLTPEIRDYRLAGGNWHSPVSVTIGAESVADWLDRQGADAGFRSAVRALRGFFLADPEDLSLLALVDQFASGGSPATEHTYRIRGGNDQLATGLAARLHGPIERQAILRRVARDADGVTVTLEQRGQLDEIRAEFLVVALPATTLREVVFEPALPEAQERAIQSLRYGPATRLLLQFARRFWRRAARPSAFGTDRDFGAVWDGNEEQRGGRGILTLLAGGRASAGLQETLAAGGAAAVVPQLAWMGDPARLIGHRAVVWEDDPWVRGGYAVFDSGFDPRLRDCLFRSAGRVVFAGEHTADRWQGYMNGALETGMRAAAEIRALHAYPAADF